VLRYFSKGRFAGAEIASSKQQKFFGSHGLSAADGGNGIDDGRSGISREN
jgi:hypothetical protein